MLDRLGWNPWQHPRQSLGKSKLFPGAAIAKFPLSPVHPSPHAAASACAPFPKRWRLQSEREWAGRVR